MIKCANGSAPGGSFQGIENADDFGFTGAVCERIARAIREGAVTSTSAMVCCLGAKERLPRWGVHGRCSYWRMNSGIADCLRRRGVRCTDVSVRDRLRREFVEQRLSRVLEHGVGWNPSAVHVEPMCHSRPVQSGIRQASWQTAERKLEWCVFTSRAKTVCADAVATNAST